MQKKKIEWTAGPNNNTSGIFPKDYSVSMAVWDSECARMVFFMRLVSDNVLEWKTLTKMSHNSLSLSGMFCVHEASWWESKPSWFSTLHQSLIRIRKHDWNSFLWRGESWRWAHSVQCCCSCCFRGFGIFDLLSQGQSHRTTVAIQQ